MDEYTITEQQDREHNIWLQGLVLGCIIGASATGLAAIVIL